MGGERGVALAALLGRLTDARISGDAQQLVTGIEIDSRTVRTGSLFVAVRGAQTDGHRYVRQAVANGARAVIVEDAAALPSGVTGVCVGDSKRALSAISAAFYGDPSGALTAIGVTGTNGKTTVTRMVASILDEAGIACGVIGTVGAEFGSHVWPLQNTTPLPPELHALLARMRDEGARAVALEVSSHALALERVEDVRFTVAALTNVTRDHLDFHQTVEAYAAAKRRLFSLAPACVLNVDDAYGARWALELYREGREVVSYGIRYAAIVTPVEIAVEPHGSRFIVSGQRFEVRLPGRFNVWNGLAAIGVARVLEIDDAVSARGLAALERVSGRMERLSGNGLDVVIDYAHTPDALESALRSLRETSAGAVTVVFGCGGDRDRGKRAEMGSIAARLADRVYVTSDNPRSEEPRAIADAIVAGVGSRDHVVELDRRLAIERAIAEARAGDVVLVAGKGHEGYQIVGDRVLQFDDVAIARAALDLRGALR
ncbi:MAG: UDP-N-acetylmuramoyl-L-alanyl-D-glutamate--2,6-diaminopimelate ligase [Candidatus Baltobacteraceae bacterium]